VGSRSKARARAQASQPAGQRAQPTRNPAPAAGAPVASAAPAAQRQQALAPGRQTPRTVLGLALVELVEAVGVLLAAILAGVATGSGKSYHLASGVAITLIGLGAALGLALVARGLRSGRRWTRTPTLLTQLFVGIVGIYLTQSARYDWGIPALVLAVAGFGLLLAPASIQLLTPGRAEPPRPR
jgi:hypothetical protein